MSAAAAMDSQANPMPVICEVCGTYFETRRGLSSHARLHLRQLGVTVSENSGAPIELLYQIIQERDGSLPKFKADAPEPLTPSKATSQQETRTLSLPEEKGSPYKAGGRVMSTPQKMDHQGSPSRLKEPTATLPQFSPPNLRLSEGSSSSSVDQHTPTKPRWAPLETDAPISLATDNNDEVHVCQLCGCWYETRKGLSSHARSHLRQIGIPEGDIKGSPIDFLYQIMEEEDLKPISAEQQRPHPSSSPPTPSAKRPSNKPSPVSRPGKRPKSSDCICILCGEEFENRKGLACHSRSHLRQIGVTDLMGKSSAIETVQELVNSGMLQAMHPPKMNAAVSSPPTPGQSRTTFPSTSLSPSPTKSPQTPVNRAPKAKKGFWLAVDPLHRKPKPEPEEVEVSAPKESGSSASGSSSRSPTKLPAAVAASSKSVTAVSSTDIQSPPTVLCDYCGQLFETRKALSCHARAHLRQLGLTWSIKTSPIDLLNEVMMHGEEGRKEPARGGASRKSGETATSSNTCTSPLDYSMKEKPSSAKRVPHPDASCELCGFEFENRKALASHARAHLRQLGVVEWRSDGATSPIDLLSELIRRDPVRVSAITRRYRTGDLYIKKAQRRAGSPSLSTDSESVAGSSLKPSGQQSEHRVSREDSGISAGSSRQSHDHRRTMAAHANSGLRSPRGVHPNKHSAPRGEENRENNSHQPPRSGSIPALLPKPPLTPLVKLVGKIYSLKCRFCEEVFQGPLSVQEQWITHLQKHILSLGYKGKASPPPPPPPPSPPPAATAAAPVAAPALVHPVAAPALVHPVAAPALVHPVAAPALVHPVAV